MFKCLVEPSTRNRRLSAVGGCEHITKTNESYPRNTQEFPLKYFTISLVLLSSSMSRGDDQPNLLFLFAEGVIKE